MGFWETAAKAGSFIADDMARTAKRCSKDTKHFNEEQREAYRNLEDNLRTASEKANAWAHRNDEDDHYYY